MCDVTKSIFLTEFKLVFFFEIGIFKKLFVGALRVLTCGYSHAYSFGRIIVIKGAIT